MATQGLPKAAEADYLTDALHRCGALAVGRVRDLLVESSRATLRSRIIRLRLTYDGDVDAPAFVILKTGLPGLMAAGVWLPVTEHHEHEHVHEPMEHAHPHTHDAHHQHEHGPAEPPGEPHTHVHRHGRLKHTHPHVPDMHHTHEHRQPKT